MSNNPFIHDYNLHMFTTLWYPSTCPINPTSHITISLSLKNPIFNASVSSPYYSTLAIWLLLLLVCSTDVFWPFYFWVLLGLTGRWWQCQWVRQAKSQFSQTYIGGQQTLDNRQAIYATCKWYNKNELTVRPAFLPKCSANTSWATWDQILTEVKVWAVKEPGKKKYSRERIEVKRPTNIIYI